MLEIAKDVFQLNKSGTIIYDINTNSFNKLLGLFSSYNGVLFNVLEVGKLEARKIINKENEAVFEMLNESCNSAQNHFFWYATSITNYFRLVFFIEFTNLNNLKQNEIEQTEIKRDIKKHIKDRLQETIPEIVKWRNKVGAHYALTDPRNDDNLVTLINSVLPVSYKRPFFTTGFYSFKNQFMPEGEVSQIPTWSITKEFDRLREEYFFTATDHQFLKIIQFEAVRKFPVANKFNRQWVKSLENKKPNLNASKKLKLKAKSFMETGNYLDAEKLYKQAIEKNCDDPILWHGLIENLCMNDKPFDAHEIFSFTINNKPHRIETYQYMTQTYGILLGQPAFALELLERNSIEMERQKSFISIILNPRNE